MTREEIIKEIDRLHKTLTGLKYNKKKEEQAYKRIWELRRLL